MSFRYMNPGLAELLDVSGGTNVIGKQYNPYGETAFWQSSSSPAVILPEVPTEIYIHVTLYLDKPQGDYPKCQFLPTDNTTGVSFQYSSYSGWSCNAIFNNTQDGSVSETDAHLEEGKLHEVIVYLKGDSNGIIAVSINGSEVLRRTGYVPLSQNVKIKCSSATFLLSNLIISDTPIDAKEHVIALPVKATETDMTANADGSYTADKAGQYLLQTIDADALLTKYGSETKITGLEFCGNPASCTGSELAKLVGIQKAKDGTVTEWGSTTLSMTPAVVRLANTMALTLEKLGNCQIGVKAGV